MAAAIAPYPLSPSVRSDVKITATYGGSGVSAIARSAIAGACPNALSAPTGIRLDHDPGRARADDRARRAAVLRALRGVPRHDEPLPTAARRTGPHLPAVPRDAGAVGAGRHAGHWHRPGLAAGDRHAVAAAEAPGSHRPGHAHPAVGRRTLRGRRPHAAGSRSRGAGG